MNFSKNHQLAAAYSKSKRAFTGMNIHMVQKVNEIDEVNYRACQIDSVVHALGVSACQIDSVVHALGVWRINIH